MGKLTTHVLDTAQGKPGAGMQLDLYALEPTGRRWVKTVCTNHDGRCDVPLLDEEEFQPGEWEIVFHVGPYFARTCPDLPHPAFLDLVPVRFGLGTDAHYHVPLLASPWSYTTYRGS